MELPERDIQILQHIVKYCQQVTATAHYFQLTEQLLESSYLMQNAVSMPILQIGELANHLTKEFRAAHAEIPWRDVIGMRNMFAHDYEKLDVKTLWLTVTEDAPELEAHCTKLLQEANQPVPTPEPAVDGQQT